MPNNTGLYGAGSTQTTPANDTTSLYGASSGSPVPSANGDLVVRGNLAVLGGNITTTATTATLFNSNATTLSIGGAATNLLLGAAGGLTGGTTTIQNNLVVLGAFSGGGGSSFGDIILGVAPNLSTITTTSGDLILDSVTNSVAINADATVSGVLKANSGITTDSGDLLLDSATGAVKFDNGTLTTNSGNVFLFNDTGITQADAFAGTEIIQIGRGDGVGYTNIFNQLRTSEQLAKNIQASSGTDGLNLYSNNTQHSIHLYDNLTQFAVGSNNWYLNSNGSTSFPNYTFPSADGTADQYLSTNGSGVLTWVTPAAGVASITAGTGINVSSPTGAVTISNTGVTGLAVGTHLNTTGSTGSITVSTDATSVNTANTIVSRDASGNFSAGTISAAILGTVSSLSNHTTTDLAEGTNLYFTTARARNSLSGGTGISYNSTTGVISLDGTSEVTSITAGTGISVSSSTGAVTVTNTGVTSAVAGTGIGVSGSTGAVTFSNTGVLSVASGGHITASTVSGAVTLGSDATSANTASTIVARDANGDFSARNINGTTFVGSNAQGKTNGFGIYSNDATAHMDVSASTATITNGIYGWNFTSSGQLEAPGNINLIGAGADTIGNTDGNLNISPASGNELHLNISPYYWAFKPNGETKFANYTFPSADGSANQVLKTNGSGNLAWYTPVDTNTTYTYAAGSTTGGANLTLTGSDATTNTVKLTNGTGVTNTYVSPTEVSIAIGQAVGTSDSPQFNNLTLSGDLAVNGLDVTTTGTGTASLFNTNATTLNLGGAATAVNIGASTGTTTVNNPLIMVDASRTLGQLIATRNATYTPPAPVLTTVTGSNGIVVSSSTGGANGYNPQVAIRNHTGDTTAAGNTSSQVLFSAATGTSGSPNGGFSANLVMGTLGYDGYTSGTSNNYASTIATTNQGAGTSGIFPLQVQGYVRQTFTNSTTVTTAVTGASGTGSVATLTFTTQNTAPYVVGQTVTIAGMTPSGYNGTYVLTAATTSSISYANATTGFTSGGTIGAANTVTAAGTGFRVRGFANTTNLTVANRINFMDLTTSAAAFKSNTYTFADEVITGSTLTSKTYLSLAPTVGTINQDTFTIKNSAATTTYATLNSTSATLNGDTVSLKNTAGTSTYANFLSTGATVTTAGATELIRTATTSGANPTLLLKRSTTATTTPIDNDGTGLRVSTAGSNGTSYGIGFFNYNYQTVASGSDHEFSLNLAQGDQTGAVVSAVQTISSKPTNTRILAGTAGAAGSTSVKLTVDANKITAAVPVVFPSYTKAQANALTGAIGWQICISDSAAGSNPNGMMAFWDTTNGRWSYIHDNSAV